MSEGLGNSPEDFVLRAIVSNPSLFVAVKDYLKPTYFDNKVYAWLYKLLKRAYGDVNKLLTLDEMETEIDLMSMDKFRNEKLHGLIDRLKNSKPVMGEYSNRIGLYIKNRMTREIVGRVIKDYKANKVSDYDKIQRSVESMNFNIVEDEFMRGNDIRKLGNGAKTLNDASQVVPTAIPGLSQYLTYNGYKKKTVNIISAGPKSGKSSLIAMEVANAIAGRDGRDRCNVLYLLVGDLSKEDGWCKIACNLMLDYTQNDFIGMDIDKIVKLVEKRYDDIFKNVMIAAYPSGTLTGDDLYERSMRFVEREFDGKIDMIAIDYIDNLRYNGDSLYERGGANYTVLERIGKRTDSVVLGGSQLKPILWDKEIIDAMNINSESSKKEAMVDLNLALGKKIPIPDEYGKALTAMTISLNRRGESGRKLWLYQDYNHCTVTSMEYKEWAKLRKKAKEKEKL